MYLEKLFYPKEYEKLVTIKHRHWTSYVQPIFIFILSLGVPVVVYFLISSLFPGILIQTALYSVVILVISIYYFSACIFLYHNFVILYLDVWILTNDRLIDLEQKTLFNRTVSEVDLFQIQDVTSEIKGMLASFFNYGDVYLQTAGKVNRFTIKNIHDPHATRQLILNLAAQDKKHHEHLNFQAHIDAQKK